MKYGNPRTVTEDFLGLLREIGKDIPAPTQEYRFALELGRQWRFDLAWVDQRVAVELDGGGFVAGRHNRAVGMENDDQKLNAATCLGWRYLRFTRRMLRVDPYGSLNMVRSLLAIPDPEPELPQLQLLKNIRQARLALRRKTA